jgi:hypothetical protein
MKMRNKTIVDEESLLRHIREACNRKPCDLHAPALRSARRAPATTTTPPKRGPPSAAPRPFPIADPYDHPLTLGAVLAAHDTLVSHASCGPAISGYGSDGDDFDGASCPCQLCIRGSCPCSGTDRRARQRPPHGPGLAGLHLRRVLGRELRMRVCPRHPRPRAHASGRDRNHRFTCHAPSCLPSAVTPPGVRRFAHAHACSPRTRDTTELVI